MGRRLCTTAQNQLELVNDMNDSPLYGLEVDGAPEGHTVIIFGREPVVFGRVGPPSADVRLYDHNVARRHFVIRWNEDTGHHEIENYGLPYTLKVNGEFLGRSERQLLELGDTLEIGQYRLRYIEPPDEEGER